MYNYIEPKQINKEDNMYNKNKYLVIFKKNKKELTTNYFIGYEPKAIIDDFKDGWHYMDKLLFIIKGKKIIHSQIK